MRGTPATRMFVTVTGSPITYASTGSCRSAAAEASNAWTSALSVGAPAPAGTKGLVGRLEPVTTSSPCCLAALLAS
jgi:hypothetical protein